MIHINDTFQKVTFFLMIMYCEGIGYVYLIQKSSTDLYNTYLKHIL